MWVRKAHLKNVGPHIDSLFEFKQGLIGVVGPNGSGKSSLLDFIYAGITNDFGRFSTNKIGCINHNSALDEDAFIELDVVHNGQEMKIVRNLRAEKSSVQVGDEKKITNAAKVQERIHEVLGLDSKLLDLFVFKQQDKIYDFLIATDAVRKKAFQRLSQTEICESLWKMLGETLNRDEELRVQVVDNSDDLARDLRSLEKSLEVEEEKRKKQESRLVPEKKLKWATTVLKKASRHADLLEDEKELLERVSTLETKTRKLTKKVKRLRKEEKEIVAARDELKEAADEARAGLKNLEQYEANRKQHRKLKDENAELHTRLSALVEPKAPPNLNDLDKITSSLALDKEKLREAKKTLAAFDEDGVVACPTCGTLVEKLQGYLKQLKIAVKSLPSSIEEATASKQQIERYLEEKRQYDRKLASIEQALKSNDDALQSFKAMKNPDVDKEALEETITEYDDASDRAENWLESRSNAEISLAKAETRNKTALEQLVKVREQLTKNAVTEEDVAKANKRNERHTAAVGNLAEINGACREIKKGIAAKQEEIDKLNVTLKRQKRIRKMAKIIERVRDAFHYDHLPLRVSQANLSLMEADVNRELKRFGSPFWVETDDNLTFKVHKPGEPVQSSSMLSTGQKVILAVSFWNALGSLWKNDIGMLCLDEPTAHLDERNRGFLAEALSVLSSKIRGNRQVILVTHADNLWQSFDQLVKLGA